MRRLHLGPWEERLCLQHHLHLAQSLLYSTRQRLLSFRHGAAEQQMQHSKPRVLPLAGCLLWSLSFLSCFEHSQHVHGLAAADAFISAVCQALLPSP